MLNKKLLSVSESRSFQKRQVHLNSLIKVRGVVTRRTSVFPQLLMTKYNCSKCGILLGPYLTEGSSSQSLIKIGNCPNCQGKGPFTINTEETVYRNFQKMTLQESPVFFPIDFLFFLFIDLISFQYPKTKRELYFLGDFQEQKKSSCLGT